MNNISVGLGLPTRFIRYNPDKNGIRINIKEQELINVLNEELKKEFLDNLDPIYLNY